MARLSVLLQVGILVWSWSTWMTNGFNLEERLSTDNYVCTFRHSFLNHTSSHRHFFVCKIEEKVKEFLGGKDGRLGALERKVEQEHVSPFLFWQIQFLFLLEISQLSRFL